MESQRRRFSPPRGRSPPPSHPGGSRGGRSPIGYRDRSPPRSYPPRDRSPPRFVRDERSPPRGRHYGRSPPPPPHRGYDRSPPPARHLERSPPRGYPSRDRSPPMRNRSPPMRYRSPPRMRSPPRYRDRSPPRGRPRSPPRYMGRRSPEPHRLERRPPPPKLEVIRGDDSDRNRSTCLYIGNLPYSFRQEDVMSMFGRFGRIQNVNVPIDRETRRNRGFVFVTFEERADAEDAKKNMEGTVIEGRKIRIDWDIGVDRKETYKNSDRPQPAGRRSMSPPPRREEFRRNSPPRRDYSNGNNWDESRRSPVRKEPTTLGERIEMDRGVSATKKEMYTEDPNATGTQSMDTWE